MNVKMKSVANYTFQRGSFQTKSEVIQITNEGGIHLIKVNQRKLYIYIIRNIQSILASEKQ